MSAAFLPSLRFHRSASFSNSGAIPLGYPRTIQSHLAGNSAWNGSKVGSQQIEVSEWSTW